MITIYNIVRDGTLATYHYFMSEAEALTYAYDKLGITHDYEVQIMAQYVPKSHFTIRSTTCS